MKKILFTIVAACMAFTATADEGMWLLPYLQKMNIKDMNSLYSLLSGCMLENSYICLNSNFIASVIDGTGDRLGSTIFDSLIIIPSRYSIAVSDKIDEMKLSDMIPDIDAWAQDGTTVILNAIYADEVVCGYYAYKTDNIYGTMHKLKRVLNTVNIAFDVAINYFRRENMRREVEHAAHTNAITKLPNLKGAVKWFESFSNSENRSKSLSISVYSMPKYTYILENYGIADIEEAVSFVAQTLQLANPSNCYIAHISEDEFTVINYYDDPNEIGDTINRATSVFFSAIESYNTDSSKEYFVEVNCGCTVVSPGWSGSLESFIKFANGEMYMNRLKSGEGKAVKQQVASKDYYKAFDLLIQKNLFTYHFQPIVSAKTGDIVAYEALMRTDASIGMNPLEVIDAAKNYRKLYEIEKATLFNVMARYAADREKFGDKKVFINSLPGHFLNDEDKGRLIELHSAYMDRFVFELTEENSVSDEELERIKYFGSTETQIAIDDYGTGHSNIVNLMRYTPHVIKIDRFLISDIHKNQNKQLFVRNIIEFAKINNILVLAEGVETSNELNTVIDLGVDLIQGYYTARPAPDPIAAIAEDIRREIISANPLFGQEE